MPRNPVRGEWWIDDSGTALYADGDVGDMGHEAYVLDSLGRSVLDHFDIDIDCERVYLPEYDKNIAAVMEENGVEDPDWMDGVKAACRKIWKDQEQAQYACDVLLERGSVDARMYSMRYDGWKRVQGHNIETWSFDTNDLKTITDGIWEAAGDDLNDDETFNIYVFVTKVWYQDVPWGVLKEDNLNKLWIYRTKDNPAPHVPVMSYASAHKWEALAKSKGVSAVARSERGFMRAYQRAGSWARLDPWWKNRRNAFVARHMAQVRMNNEKLWKPDKSGNLRPSRRALALLMWAYFPPKRFS